MLKHWLAAVAVTALAVAPVGCADRPEGGGGGEVNEEAPGTMGDEDSLEPLPGAIDPEITGEEPAEVPGTRNRD